MAGIPEFKTIPYNDDYSLMIYQSDSSLNITYRVTTTRYSLNGDIGSTDTFNGEFNTQLIIDFSGVNDTVAKFCDNATLTDGVDTYSDWYLPSTEELLAVYNAGYILSTYVLWTSTENDTTTAFRFDASTGLFIDTPKIDSIRAIPVRKVYLNDYVIVDRMKVQSKDAPILRGGENNADEDVYKMLGGVNGISKNSNILSNE